MRFRPSEKRVPAVQRAVVVRHCFSSRSRLAIVLSGSGCRRSGLCSTGNARWRWHRADASVFGARIGSQSTLVRRTAYRTVGSSAFCGLVNRTACLAAGHIVVRSLDRGCFRLGGRILWPDDLCHGSFRFRRMGPFSIERRFGTAGERGGSAVVDRPAAGDGRQNPCCTRSQNSLTKSCLTNSDIGSRCSSLSICTQNSNYSAWHLRIRVRIFRGRCNRM